MNHLGDYDVIVIGAVSYTHLNGCVAVGVVGTQHRTNGVGGFAVCMAGIVAALVHGIQDAAVDRLQDVYKRQALGIFLPPLFRIWYLLRGAIAPRWGRRTPKGTIAHILY